MLVNNASSLGPVPLALLADTECEDLELALATNVLGPFRLTKALLGALAASAREGRGSVVLNISSDAAVNAYPQWGAYGASKAALRHMSRIWDEELAAEGVRVLSLDPGDMDTPLHALAVPDADPATLKRPETAARELADAIAACARCELGASGSLRAGRSCGGHPMIAASRPVQRPRDARLLVVHADGRISHAPRSRFVDLLRPGDLVIANDAATLPASLHGVHLPTGAAIEVRLAGRASLDGRGRPDFSAVVFGAGDFRTRTEDRPLPPMLAPGDRLALGPLVATVEALLDHPRLVSLRFDGSASSVWAGLARHGRPIQYAHLPSRARRCGMSGRRSRQRRSPSSRHRRALRSTGRRSARCARAASSSPPSRYAAGISSTGDPELDRRLPFDEPYRIPDATAAAIRRARSRGGRIIAVGTTVVRALEHAARRAGVVPAGRGVANQRLGPFSRLRVVDAILSGTHEPGSSHYQLLRAFLDDATLAEAQRGARRDGAIARTSSATRC